MDFTNLKLEKAEYDKIVVVLTSLKRQSNAQSVCLISRSGQEIAFEGNTESLDRQALSSLAASNLAATFGLASLIGESEFERIYHRGEHTSILINPVGELGLLLFLFDNEVKSGLDLNGLRRATLILRDVLDHCNEKNVELRGDN